MADFKVKVIAETQDAEQQLRGIEKVADKATKERDIKISIPNYTDVTKNFRELNKDINNAANSVKQFYQVASKLPVGPIAEINQLGGQLTKVAKTAAETGKSVGDAGDILKSTFDTANRAAESLVSRLTRIAVSLYVIKEAAGIVQSAFGGMFNETIGREIKLRETILKTQTTLASTNKVFKNGKEITDPYQKIVSLTGAVRKNIDSIRERSIALAGVTSGEVIEVFGMVSSQVGQIGGGLKEAEDLAINFAAALGTFGIPLYQARQEIGSILRGDITTDSYLAKALGITNDDINKAKSQTGGVVKFLDDRLAAAVAGQRIAAEGFTGVVSNIKDLGELISQNFGAGLLDPLLDGLTKTFESLFNIRNQLFDISRLAGRSIGTIANSAVKLVGGATGGRAQSDPSGDTGALKATESAIKGVTREVRAALSTVYLQIATLVERISSAFSVLSKGLANLALGLLSLKLEQFKALIGVVEAISPALLTAVSGLGGFLAIWGEFMKIPLVQSFSQITLGMRVLQSSGVMPLISTATTLALVLKSWGGIFEKVKAQFVLIRTIIGGVIIAIGNLIAQVGRASVAMLNAWAPAGKALQALRTELLGVASQLESVGNAAQRTGDSVGGLGNNFEKVGGGLKTFIFNMIRFNIIMFAISAILSTVAERFSAYKESQDKLASDKRAEVALYRLSTTYKNLGENATEAQKRAKAFEQSLVDQKYDETVANLEKVRKKLKEVQDAFGPKEGFVAKFAQALQSVAATFNPENFDIVGKQLRGDYVGTDITSFGQAVAQKLSGKEKQAAIEKAKYEAKLNANAAADNIQLEAQKRTDLTKEIAAIQRQQQNDLFQLRQQQAQKEVEIFRAAGDLRIFQMELANAKLIEGEEGASRSALEALNSYLSTRERGELDIEAGKKAIVIESTNLERQIADYRLDTEKKIAEIRQRAGDYETKVAQYRQQMATQTAETGQIPAAGGVSAGFRVGSTGRSSGPHLDLRSPTNDKQAVINEAIAIIKAWQQQNLAYMELSNAKIDVKNITDEGKLRQALAREQQVHGRRAGGGAVDIAVPQGTLVPVPAGTPSWGGNGGWQATSLNTGNVMLHGLGDSTASPTGPNKGVPAAALPPPKAPSYADIGAPAIDKYREAVLSLTGAMERMRSLQAALTEANTAAAFDRIAKAAFPQVEVEQYRNEIVASTVSLGALATVSADAYDPDRLQIAIDQKSKLFIAQEEEDEILANANKKLKAGKLTEQELNKLKEDLNKKQAVFVVGLEKEAKLRVQALSLARQLNAIKQLKQERNAIPYDIQRSGVDAAASMSQTFDSENLPRQRVIAAEVAIAKKRISLEQDQSKTVEQVNIELRAFAIETRAAADILGQLDTEAEKFKTAISLISEGAKTLTDGYKGFLKSVLTGGNIQESMATMVKGFSDKFLNMALDAAFKPLEASLTQQFKDIFNIKDPLAELQAQNNLALGSNTTALKGLSTALTTAPIVNSIGTAVQPEGSSTSKSSLAYAVGPNVGNYPKPPVLNITPDKTIEPAYNNAPFVTPETFQFFDKIPEAGADMSNLSLSVGDLASVVNAAGAQVQMFGASLAAVAPASGGAQPGLALPGVAPGAAPALTNAQKWQKGFGGAMGIAAGVGSIVGGIGTMKKKGTYNKLMGLSGVFMGLGSIVSQFSPGAAFGKRERGGPVIANRPYIVGEKRPELFVPSSNGTIIPSVPGGMSDPLSFEKSQNSDPTAAAQAALGRQIFTSERTSQEMEYSRERTNANSGLKVETIRMGNMNVVTEEQMFQALSAAEQRGAKQGEARVFRRLKNDTRIPGIR